MRKVRLSQVSTFNRTSGGTGTAFIYFAGKMIKNSTGYITPDARGSNGKFFPYGTERPSATTNDKEKFTGYFRDAETGLDYAQNRYHSAGDGRFTSPDPSHAANPKNPNSWNQYAYAGGDPANNTDPSGLDWVADGIGGYCWDTDLLCLYPSFCSDPWSYVAMGSFQICGEAMAGITNVLGHYSGVFDEGSINDGYNTPGVWAYDMGHETTANAMEFSSAFDLATVGPVTEELFEDSMPAARDIMDRPDCAGLFGLASGLPSDLLSQVNFQYGSVPGYYAVTQFAPPTGQPYQVTIDNEIGNSSLTDPSSPW